MSFLFTSSLPSIGLYNSAHIPLLVLFSSKPPSPHCHPLFFSASFSETFDRAVYMPSSSSPPFVLGPASLSQVSSGASCAALALSGTMMLKGPLVATRGSSSLHFFSSTKCYKQTGRSPLADKRHAAATGVGCCVPLWPPLDSCPLRFERHDMHKREVNKSTMTHTFVAKQTFLLSTAEWGLGEARQFKNPTTKACKRLEIHVSHTKIIKRRYFI